MSAASTLVELVRALTWPVVVLVLFLTFRGAPQPLLRERLTKVKGPGFKAEFERSRVETEAAAVTATVAAGGTSLPLGALPDELVARGERDPSGSILAAYEFLSRELRQRLDDAGVDTLSTANWNANRLAALAAQQGVITEQSAEAVRGLTVLRNLVAHGGATDAGPNEAAEYRAMVEGVLYSFHKPGTKPAEGLASGLRTAER